MKTKKSLQELMELIDRLEEENRALKDRLNHQETRQHMEEEEMSNLQRETCFRPKPMSCPRP